MATNYSQKICFSWKFFIALPFWNNLEYWNANRQLRSPLKVKVAKSCTNLVMFGGVTPEKRLLIFVTFVKKNCKNAHIRLIISDHDRSISTNYSALIDIWVGIINLTFVLRSLKTAVVTNQLTWGTFYKRQIWTTPVIVLFIAQKKNCSYTNILSLLCG